MQSFKRWIRQTAITMLVSGVILADSNDLYGMLAGVAAALGISMAIAILVWWIKINDEVPVYRSKETVPDFDETDRQTNYLSTIRTQSFQGFNGFGR